MLRNSCGEDTLNSINSQPPVALITGGARRIGAAIATQLHQAGFNVVIQYLNSEADAIKLAGTLNTIKPNSAFLYKQDLKSYATCKNIINATIMHYGRLDVLINNASIFHRTNIKRQLSQLENMLTINCQAPLWLSLEAYPYLKANFGCIINITDIHAKQPLKGYTEYCQSKAALEMQTKSLALEFAPQVRVNAIAPGAIAWPEQDNVLDADTKKKIIAKIPLQRHGTPQDVANAILLLVKNTYITGQTIKVAGGRYT